MPRILTSSVADSVLWLCRRSPSRPSKSTVSTRQCCMSRGRLILAADCSLLRGEMIGPVSRVFLAEAGVNSGWLLLGP